MLHCLVCEWDVHGKRVCDERKVFIECCEFWSGRVLKILVRLGLVEAGGGERTVDVKRGTGRMSKRLSAYSAGM